MYFLFHTELIVLAGTSSCWMLSEEEDCSLEILGFEHLSSVSISLLENLKSRRSEITLEFGGNRFLAETGHSQELQDCD
jgi:hypothetical protein